jgi:hypothetical protein
MRSYSFLTLFIFTHHMRQQANRIPYWKRLDFVSFTNAPPTVGTCTDTFTVEGATTMAPTICGVNSGQHSKQNSAKYAIWRNIRHLNLFELFSVPWRPFVGHYSHWCQVNIQICNWNNNHSIVEYKNCDAPLWCNLSRYDWWFSQYSKMNNMFAYLV